MPVFPDTPKTLLGELALKGALDEEKWRRFDELYRPVVREFLVQRFPSLARDADDLVQETMVRLVRTLREGRYDVERARFRTFLAVVAFNLAANALRRDARYAALPLETVDWAAERPVPSAACEVIDRQWREACYRAARRHVLQHMPVPPRYAEVWRALEKGEGAESIAARLGVSAAFVRQVKHRVTKLIAAVVETYGD